MSIGYQSNDVPAPTSLDDLLGDAYRGAVAINGDPTQAGAAFAAVGLATVQSGGTPASTYREMWGELRSSTTPATSFR